MYQMTGIYFIDSTNTYHRITCDLLTEDNVIGYKAIEFERNKVSIDGQDTQNLYPQNATACYKCIVSSNYESINEDSLKDLSEEKRKSYYTALARERYASHDFR